MRKSLLTLGAIFAITGAAVFTSGCNSAVKGCMESKDDNYNASATESDNSCNEDSTTGKFTGTFAVNETCPGGNSTYNVTITQSATTDYAIVIAGFAGGVSGGGFANNVTAGVSKNSFDAPSQEPDNDDFLVESTGTITGNTLNFSYKVTNNLGISTTCQCTATKQ